MEKLNSHRLGAALALVSLCACSALKDAGDDCAGTFRPIHEVQGGGPSSPLAGQRVTVRGVVVGDFQGPDRLAGFFLQNPHPDDDPRTSEGIFAGGGDREVAVGDLVQVSGQVEESSGLTELIGVDVAVCGRRAAPAPVPIAHAEIGDLEPFEGMRVNLAGDLTVAGTRELGTRGQLLLAAGGRPFAGIDGESAGRRGPGRLVLDDGSRVNGLQTPPYLDDAGTRRAGDMVSGLIGVISEQPGGHALHPTAPPRFTSSNRRAAAPPAIGGTVKVAGFNLLNYFTTLGQRGAADAAELERQRAKHAAAISSLDADVVGLSELENNGETTIRDLVDTLNARQAREAAGGAGFWAHVPDPAGGAGDDAIRVGLIYRPSTVRPIGPPRVDRDPVFKRPPFAQTFEAAGERFTVVVNHFKSKGCGTAEGPEQDAGDGQGCWNPLRVRQAHRLLEFVARLQAASADADVLVIGDLNAYGAEDPIRTLTGGGLIDQLAEYVPAAERYSYVYMGEAGYLDHALTTPSLARRVTGAAFWHINADEPPFLDYRSRPADGLGVAERGRPLGRPDPYRSSDHDPVLIGLSFQPEP